MSRFDLVNEVEKIQSADWSIAHLVVILSRLESIYAHWLSDILWATWL